MFFISVEFNEKKKVLVILKEDSLKTRKPPQSMNVVNFPYWSDQRF